MSAPVRPEEFVRWLRQTAPYLHAFGGRTFVIGFGGELITERARFAQFIQDVNLLAALDIRLVLVHGARPQIEAELKAKGLRSRYARGLRVTDAAALVAVKHAAGALRVEIEALLSQGLPSSPMAGAEIRVASGNYIAAQPIGVLEGVDFQFTGLVRKVDATAIARRLEAGEVVLVPHIGYSPTGEVFNLSWEDVAQSVAAALRADKLLLFVDRLPVDRKGAAIGELTAREAEALLKKAELGAHATRALRHALAALAAGVGRAHLISRRTPGAALLELFTHSGVGTMITAEPMQRLREARIDDVGAFAEEVLLHLLGEVLAGADIRQVQAILVHQHGLVLEPLRPGFLRHVLEDALAQFARIGREVEALGLAAELDAFHRSCHGDQIRLRNTLEPRFQL